ncbi:DUF418 domain-containing protein [Actinoplanes sp. CA-252034]|uniref:DUF418 domain-containing protein n=1 Tax=Actinoplanes sp. CA-252034 TaxID=3239906 RepID=UPI003D96A643
MLVSAQEASSGPVTPGARALGPDLARGFMLLFIALANTHYFLRSPIVIGGYPQDGSAPDRTVIWLLTTFADGRAFPLFGLLFGYGTARMVSRHQTHHAQQPTRWATRRLLWRRAAALVVIGLTDAVLFYVGDILAAYGVLLLFGALMVFWRDRWLLVTAGAFLMLNALPSADPSTISPSGPDTAMLPPTLTALFPERFPTALVIAALGPLGFLCPFALGLWAGRRRILEHPARHRRLLRRTAATGVLTAVLGAQPIALLLSGVTTPPPQPALEWLAALHSTTGVLGGFGYAALFALLSLARDGRPAVPAPPTAGPQTAGQEACPQPAEDRPGAVTRAIAAAGRRSMTCYLMQSVTWAVVFTPFLLNLSGTLTITGTATLAIATWAVTVLIADRMRAADHRGPFEALTRRITYGRPRPTAPQPATRPPHP